MIRRGAFAARRCAPEPAAIEQPRTSARRPGRTPARLVGHQYPGSRNMCDNQLENRDNAVAIFENVCARLQERVTGTTHPTDFLEVKHAPRIAMCGYVAWRVPCRYARWPGA